MTTIEILNPGTLAIPIFDPNNNSFPKLILAPLFNLDQITDLHSKPQASSKTQKKRHHRATVPYTHYLHDRCAFLWVPLLSRHRGVRGRPFF
jgi:hypothetical protein